jgi:hypothetical protein
MKINAKIDLLLNAEGLTIRVYDDDAKNTFLEMDLNKDETLSALSRVCRTPISKCEVYNLDKISKIAEFDTIIVKMKDWTYTDRKEKAKETVNKYLISNKLKDAGWELWDSFEQQNSFFTKDKNNYYCRANIKRWVTK